MTNRTSIFRGRSPAGASIERTAAPRARGSCASLATLVTLVALLLPAVASQPAAAGGTPITGAPQASAGQAADWARARSANSLFVDLAWTFWDVAPAHGNVRPEVLYALSAKETGYMRYNGAIVTEFNNPCGLKSARGGGDSDLYAHARFGSWAEGIAACADHLALYAGAPGYPLPSDMTPDPRHSSSLYGVATTVEALGGKWAPSPEYGTSIVNDLLAGILGRPPSSESRPAPAGPGAPPVEEVVEHVEPAWDAQPPSGPPIVPPRVSVGIAFFVAGRQCLGIPLIVPEAAG